MGRKTATPQRVFPKWEFKFNMNHWSLSTPRRHQRLINFFNKEGTFHFERSKEKLDAADLKELNEWSCFKEPTEMTRNSKKFRDGKYDHLRSCFMAEYLLIVCELSGDKILKATDTRNGMIELSLADINVDTSKEIERKEKLFGYIDSNHWTFKVTPYIKIRRDEEQRKAKRNNDSCLTSIITPVSHRHDEDSAADHIGDTSSFQQLKDDNELDEVLEPLPLRKSLGTVFNMTDALKINTRDEGVHRRVSDASTNLMELDEHDEDTVSSFEEVESGKEVRLNCAHKLESKVQLHRRHVVLTIIL